MSDFTDQLDDIQQQVEDHDSRLDTVDETTSQISDSVADHEERIATGEQSLQEVSDRAGQLDLPSTQDTIDRIKDCFPTGTVTLIAGSITLTDNRINPATILLLTLQSFSGVPTIGVGDKHIAYTYVCSNGSAVISSNYSADTSTLGYVIF